MLDVPDIVRWTMSLTLASARQQSQATSSMCVRCREQYAPRPWFSKMSVKADDCPSPITTHPCHGTRFVIVAGPCLVLLHQHESINNSLSTHNSTRRGVYWSFIHSLTHSLIHAFIHSGAHLCVHECAVWVLVLC
jgi:hypothetical protein